MFKRYVPNIESIESRIVSLYCTVESYDQNINDIKERISAYNRRVNFAFIETVKENPSIASYTVDEYISSKEAPSELRELRDRHRGVRSELSRLEYVFAEARVKYLMTIDRYEKLHTDDRAGLSSLPDGFDEAYASRGKYIFLRR